MHRLGRQSQRREAAEAEVSFTNFRDAKLVGGVEEDSTPLFDSCSILSSPRARMQRQNLTCVLQSSQQNANIKNT